MNRYSWKWRRGALALLMPLVMAGCGPVEHPEQPSTRTSRLETDPAAPTASLSHPIVGQPVTGTINFGVVATDDAGVTRVDILVDGALYLSRSYTATPSVSFFQYWDSTTAAEGPHTVQVRAYDASNKVGESTSVEFFVDRTAPTATLTSPVDGATVGERFVTVTAAVEDAHGIGWVDLLVDGSVYGQASEPPYTLTWDTTYFNGGTYTLSVRAHDAAGNPTESTPVQVQLPADTQAPHVSIASPAEGASVSGMLWVTADATDDRQIMFLELLVDGMPVAGSSMAASPIYWDSTMGTNGPHTLEVRARDFAGNSTLSAPVHIVIDNSAPPPPPPPTGNAVYDASRGAPGCEGAGESRCDSGDLLVGRGTVGPEQNAPNTLATSCQDGASGGFHGDESLERLKVSTEDGTPLAVGKTVRIEATVWAWGDGSADALDLYYTSAAATPAWTYLTTLTPGAGGEQVLSTAYTLPAGSLQAVRGVFRYMGSPGLCSASNYDDHDDLFFGVQ